MCVLTEWELYLVYIVFSFGNSLVYTITFGFGKIRKKWKITLFCNDIILCQSVQILPIRALIHLVAVRLALRHLFCLDHNSLSIISTSIASLRQRYCKHKRTSTRRCLFYPQWSYPFQADNLVTKCKSL